MTAILVAEQLGRWYGQVAGLTDLTVQLDRGITGLLGPNGAGKSTLLKLVAGELKPSRGSLRVLGLPPFANAALFRRLGFAPQQDALYDDQTGLEFVTFLLSLHGYARREARARAQRALERVGLGSELGRKTGEYSKGMRQRVRLAQAIAHDPELVIADEPLNGLDPVGRHEILQLLRELGDRGTHVLMSSHVLHEVQSLTEEVLLLHRGRLLAHGSTGDIRKLLNKHPHKVDVVARDSRALAALLLESPTVTSVRLGPFENQLTVETSDIEDFYRRLPSVVDRCRPGIYSVTSADTSLEAVFDYLVG